MPLASVTIHGVEAGITAEQAKKKLANLYKRPEEKFDVVSRSLFVKNQPFVLIKDIDQAEADLHKERLIKLGFICEHEQSFAQDESGLALAPVDAVKAVDVDCPACEQPSGGGDICKNCDVIISKYLEHQSFDNQLQSQIKSSSYSQERMQESRVEKIDRDKKIEQAKKLNKVAGKKKSDTPEGDSSTSATNSTAVENQIRVDSDVKTSKKLYAVVASVCLTIVGAGFIAYQLVDNPLSKDEALAAQGSEDSTGFVGTTENLAAIDSANAEPEEIIPETVFDFQILHQRELISIEKKIGRLYDEDMVFSIAHMISAKEDPREKIFAKQALIKIEEFDQQTVGELEGIYAMLGDLDKNFDRVQMLLNHASIYNQFELPKQSAELLEQVNTIASDIESSEDQIMAKVAFAEYQLLHGDSEVAKASYQQAKAQSLELSPQLLIDSANKYIAISEANNGLSNPVQSSNGLITAVTIEKNTDNLMGESVDTGAMADSPDLGAAQQSTEIGDPLIDDLIKMTKQNKQKLKAASGLLGQ